MTFNAANIKEMGIGVVNGLLVEYPQCPYRFKQYLQGQTRELFRHSREILPYFWHELFPGHFPYAEARYLKNGNRATVTKRTDDMVEYLSEWFSNNTIAIGLAYHKKRPIEGIIHKLDRNKHIAHCIWPVESAWRKGGEQTTSYAGLLKLSDKCFNYPALVLKNEMLILKNIYPELRSYHLHIVGLDKKFDHPRDQHRVLKWNYDIDTKDSFEKMMDAAIYLYDKMESDGWAKEEGRFRCRFCPAVDCMFNYKTNPHGYKKKYYKQKLVR